MWWFVLLADSNKVVDLSFPAWGRMVLVVQLTPHSLKNMHPRGIGIPAFSVNPKHEVKKKSFVHDL